VNDRDATSWLLYDSLPHDGRRWPADPRRVLGIWSITARIAEASRSRPTVASAPV